MFLIRVHSRAFAVAIVPLLGAGRTLHKFHSRSQTPFGNAIARETQFRSVSKMQLL